MLVKDKKRGVISAVEGGRNSEEGDLGWENPWG